jgi:5'-nucleotidase
MAVLRTPEPSEDPDTDESLLAAGYITVTSIVGIQEAPSQTDPANHLKSRWDDIARH